MHRRQVREGHRCSCAAAERRTSLFEAERRNHLGGVTTTAERRTSLFEAELSAKVTDGTERLLDATSQADLSPAACKCSPRRPLSPPHRHRRGLPLGGRAAALGSAPVLTHPNKAG